MTWDPHTYPDTIRAEVHDYDTLQEKIVEATSGLAPLSILELGVGAGETAKRTLEMHPGAHLVGIDSSPEMLSAAATTLPRGRVTLLQQDLSSPLPEQEFDLVISALAIHHLQGDGKAKLFREVREHLVPGGTFVMGDVVIPEDPSDAVIENEPGYDFPDSIEDQRRWMAGAGLSAEVVWVRGDLAVLRAVAPKP